MKKSARAGECARRQRQSARDTVHNIILSKRGEGAIIANLIIFVAVMALAATTVFLFKSSIDESANQATAEGDRTASVMKTDFTVSASSYSGGTIYVYVKNTGTEQFDPDDLDIYIDDIRIPRDPANRTVSVTSDTDTINTGIWDEKEELEFNVFITYSTPETHSVQVSTPNGVSASSEFSS